jgi:hypothetical protein
VGEDTLGSSRDEEERLVERRKKRERERERQETQLPSLLSVPVEEASHNEVVSESE